jgi:hypothetical protein
MAHGLDDQPASFDAELDFLREIGFIEQRLGDADSS